MAYGRMDERYFAEKQQSAVESVQRSIEKATAAMGAIQANRYTMPDLTAPADVHELLVVAQRSLQEARRYYETARWAAALTDLEFNDWLIKEGLPELVIG